jgi:hypothetical protein
MSGEDIGSQIPSSIGMLTSLTSLNLANTQLYGKIPVEIAQLALLTELNLANNDLSGIFPDISKLQNLTVLNLTSNANLTGITYLVAQIQDNPDSGKESTNTSIIAISVASSIVILIIFCSFIVYRCYIQPILMARKQTARDDESYEYSGSDQSAVIDGSDPGLMMDIFGGRKKLRITEQISKGGFGFVYKGVYNGRQVAVKQLIAPHTKREKLKLAKMFGMYLLLMYFSRGSSHYESIETRAYCRVYRFGSGNVLDYHGTHAVWNPYRSH